MGFTSRYVVAACCEILSPDPVFCLNQRFFGEIYDATVSYGSKNVMPKIGLSGLSIGDVVLAETYCVRMLRHDIRVSGAGDNWHSGFHLSSVSLLFRSPRPVLLRTEDTFTGSL